MIRHLTAAALLLAVAVSGCGKDSNPVTPLDAALMTKVAGDAQKGPTGEALPTPLAVLVTDANGTPIPNVKVNWGVEAGGGSLSALSSLTDQNGTASITWTLGTAVGQAVKAWTDVEGAQSVNFSATGQTTIVLHYDGTSWSRSLVTEFPIPINTGWAASPSLAFAAGGNCPDLVLAPKYTGAWTGTDRCVGTSLTITSMWGAGPSDVWAVGTGNGARIMEQAHYSWVFHFDGTTWTYSYTDPTPSPGLNGVGSRSADDVIAVGNLGRIFRHVGTQWIQQTSGTTSNLYAVWGDPNSSSVFAVGNGGTIVHYDGTSWQPQASGTTAALRGVWGTSENDVFAVGAGGTILHYNGSSWTTQSTGSTQDLLSIWGSSSNSVFAVGKGNTLLRYNGTSWAPQSTGIPATDITSVWGTSPSNVFVGIR